MDTNHKDVTSCLELDTSSKPTLHLTLYTIHHNNNREAMPRDYFIYSIL
jgi:hypothetical protein